MPNGYRLFGHAVTVLASGARAESILYGIAGQSRGAPPAILCYVFCGVGAWGHAPSRLPAFAPAGIPWLGE